MTRPYQSRRDIPAPAADAGLTPARLEKLGWPLWRMALVIVFGAFMSGLDASVANIGLNTIRTDLHTSLDQVQWVTNGYLVAFATSLPVCGWLGRRSAPGACGWPPSPYSPPRPGCAPPRRASIR